MLYAPRKFYNITFKTYIHSLILYPFITTYFFLILLLGIPIDLIRLLIVTPIVLLTGNQQSKWFKIIHPVTLDYIGTIRKARYYELL